jgi:3-mercaptopyruvate sulfurtransferase SseA
MKYGIKDVRALKGGLAGWVNSGGSTSTSK